jgi:glycosyltransferase involved in cell wall biosynthesis
MKQLLRSLVLCALVSGAAALVRAAEPIAASDKKVIYHGWNTRDSAYVAKNWARMERMPFDGVGINIALDRTQPTTGDGSTTNLLGWQIFGPERFDLSRFGSAITDLQKPRWKRFTDNFLPVAIATRDQDQGLSWFDDVRWTTIENNWRVLLTIARQGRCRGLLLDPEHYDYDCELFNYGHHREQRADRSFAEYAAAARARGRQLGGAMRELFPEITVGLLYGYTLPARELRERQPLDATRYALLPAFLDGLLEASAPQAKFVDLWEFGHGYKTRAQFMAARSEIESAADVTGNPAAYHAAITPGMSLRLDFPSPLAPWQTRSTTQNYFSPPTFEIALRSALEASDRYVWIYSEQAPQFFPRSKLPASYVRAFRLARQPAKIGSIVSVSVGLASVLALGLWFPVSRLRHRVGAAPSGAMRILMVTGIFPPDRGGPASYVPKMAAALVRRGHAVEVICLSDRLPHDDSSHPFRVHRLPRGRFWPTRILLTTFTVWRAAWRHDLVYVNGLGAEAALGALLAVRPAVHKIVGDYAWERAVGRGWFGGTIDEYQATRKSPLLRLLDSVRSFPLKLAERIIVPSHYLRRIVSGWEIASGKIHVIPNAVARVTAPESASPLASWNGKTLITVCRLVPWKGIDPLIRLLPELPETRLVIAGDGQLRTELEALARSLGVAARTVFLGDVPQAAVNGYLAQADAFILNSTYEGLPHVVLEAIAAGTPVIATNAGGTSEVVEHDATGLLVPVGDRAALKSAIEQLWRDPALGERLAEEASARSRMHFDFEAMVAATEGSLYAALATPREPITFKAEEAS